MQKGEAEAAKALCTKLDDKIEREQDKNAKLIAKVKGTEKNMEDILGQVEGVKAMHNVLLESLGEANETIQRGRHAEPAIAPALRIEQAGIPLFCAALNISLCLVQSISSGRSLVMPLTNASSSARLSQAPPHCACLCDEHVAVMPAAMHT